MRRFVIEHLPRLPAAYLATPLDYDATKEWLEQPGLISLIRTTEMIAAVEAGLGVSLVPSDDAMLLHPGDEALLLTLSFGVLLAWAEGNIPPLAEDWRATALTVEAPREVIGSPALKAAIAEDFLSEEPGLN